MTRKREHDNMRKKTLVMLILILTGVALFGTGCLEQRAETPGPTATSPQTTTPAQTPEPDQTTQTPTPTTQIQPTPVGTTTPETITQQPTTTPPQTIVQRMLPDGEDYELEKTADGYNKPLYLTHAGDGSDRIFIVEQRGVIWILDKDRRQIETPYLDISARVRSGGEQGLLGLAFHPQYRENGLFYVHYSDKKGDTVISRFKVSENPDRANGDSEEIIMTAEQPYSNHNGGQIAFGPDGYLYIGLGDGGSGGDPLGNGQNTDTLLGAILRIDVDGENTYNIPAGNPFKEPENGRPEIWTFGLRNPWRFSFDRLTGDLYIGDVGQNQWEEINHQDADNPGGENYGWNQMEGSHCYKAGCASVAYTPPVAEYSHREGCSVTGGYVYRGAIAQNLDGIYIYGDYCSGRIWTLQRLETGQWESKTWLDTSFAISSFGEDGAGEIYVIDHGGGVYRIKPKSET
jgi:glucose/arabinose dehydrogenase